jgi:hypothetical protein
MSDESKTTFSISTKELSIIAQTVEAGRRAGVYSFKDMEAICPVFNKIQTILKAAIDESNETDPGSKKMTKVRNETDPGSKKTTKVGDVLIV